MRRELIIFAVILAVVLVLGLFGRSLILNIAVGQFRSMFPGYDVSIGSAEVRNVDMVALSNIYVKKGDALSYRVKSVEINLSPLSLFTRVVPKVTVKNSYLEISSRDKKLKDIIEYPVFKPGKGFTAKSIAVLNFNLTLDTVDWTLNTVANGNIEMRKAPAGETEIKGDFSVVPGGWKIAIKDEAFLKKLAENAKQPPAVIEDLKDFDFTKGALQISGKPGSLLFHIMLEGAKGKKDLTFPLRGL